MVKDIRDLTIGEIEDLLMKQYSKVKKANYWRWDKKNMALNTFMDLTDAVIKIKKNKRFINDDEYVDSVIKDFQEKPYIEDFPEESYIYKVNRIFQS